MASERTGRFFSVLRKAAAVIQILISSVLLFTIILNAETWFFCQKFNGDDARLIVMPITASGIIIGALSLKNVRFFDILTACWFTVYFAWIIGNRIC